MTVQDIKRDVASSKQDPAALPSRFDAISSDFAADIFDGLAEEEEYNGLKSSIAETTEKHRDRAIYILRFHHKVDADQVWVDLCRNDAKAQRYCMAFLQIYVLSSVRKRLTTGPEEYVEERAVKSCRSLNTFWKALVAAADATVLLPKRRDNPDNHWMELKRPKNFAGSRDEGPIAQISHWIYHECAEKLGLAATPEYKVVELTSRDIGVILKTLWLRADDIPLPTPSHRVTFHALVILFGFGFRQGMIMGAKFGDFALAIVRDPENRSKRRLVATITIYRNKLRREALEHKKGEKLSFSVTLLPYPLFCLTHLLAVRGIHLDAFEAGFHSVAQLLHQPNLENVNYIPLRWKREMLDQEVFPMSYGSFTRTLYRTLLVAGFPSPPRAYAFRVGASADFDGCLTPALRNFVISHTTDVYENNYMTERVREDLARCRFKGFAGENDPLFGVLRDLSLHNDSGAPIYPTPEQKRGIERRRDVAAHEAALEVARQCGVPGELQKAKAALYQLRRRLELLLVMDSRDKYFAEAASSRARGLSTDHLRTPGQRLRGDHATLHIARLVELWTGRASSAGHAGDPTAAGKFEFDDRAGECSEMAMNWLLHYMAMKWAHLATPLPDPAKDQTGNGPANERSICFLCAKHFEQRSSLTRHCKKTHVANGSFNNSFSCPECERLGLKRHVVSSASEWSNHVERLHGRLHAPVLVSTPPKTGTNSAPASAKRKRVIKAEHIPGIVVFDSLEHRRPKKARDVREG